MMPVTTRRNEFARSLTTNRVHLEYRLTESLSDAAQEEACALLSRAELQRYNRYRARHDQRDYATAHALLRTSLSRYGKSSPASWSFTTGRHGKPELAVLSRRDTPLTFSLSHTRGLVACAIGSGTALGIDVERVDVAFEFSSIAARYFHPVERAQLDRCRHDVRGSLFVDLWTLKEAYTKATGEGLSETMSGFGFQIEDEVIRFVPPAYTGTPAWQFALYALESGYRIGVAIANSDGIARHIAVAAGERPDDRREADELRLTASTTIGAG